MKVIEGGFGAPDDTPNTTLLEAVIGCLEVTEMTECTEGKFLLVVDSEDRFTFMTNQKDMGQLLILAELVKDSVLAQVMTKEKD